MRSIVALVAAPSLLTALVIATGCAKKTEDAALTTGGPPNAGGPTRPGGPEEVGQTDTEGTVEGETGEETEEQKLARGREVMSQYEDATEPPVDWSWTPETSINPRSIPDERVAGVCVGKLFIVKHAIIRQHTDDTTGAVTWDLRFLDVKPEPGDEVSMLAHDGRHIELKIPRAGKGVKIETPYGDADAWDMDSQWFWYHTPKVDAPDGIPINPGSDVALYLEFTDWDETPPKGIEDALGKAKGKIAVASKWGFANDVNLCWLAGRFEAIIAKPEGT